VPEAGNEQAIADLAYDFLHRETNRQFGLCVMKV